ncbi:unnamed protein product [Diabrotica balteata]|uniref:BED-type domain-containing protein n=1 Tax=Diabrotica balteata TaxID=107213 RepID=A0A9N9TFW1_DIABA|nr:unnamed protein product [Diabrotica balteata]
MDEGPSTSKKVKYGDKNYEETLLKWLDDVDDDISEFESICDGNVAIDSDHERESEIEGKLLANLGIQKFQQTLTPDPREQETSGSCSTQKNISIEMDFYKPYQSSGSEYFPESEETDSAEETRDQEDMEIYLPNDSHFGDVECALKTHQRLYTDNDYIEIMRSCRVKNKFVVNRLRSEEMVSVSLLLQSITNRKTDINKDVINWLKTHVIHTTKENPTILYMKKHVRDQQFSEVNIEKSDKNYAKCRLCSKRIKTCGNTSNLKCHLKSTHKEFSFKNGNSSIKKVNSDVQESVDVITDTEYNDDTRSTSSLSEISKSSSSFTQQPSTSGYYAPTPYKRQKTIVESVKRFLELRDIINQIVNRHSPAPGMINAREAEELKEVQDILLPLETATKPPSGEKYTTSSIVIPMIFNIKKKIEGSTPKYEIGKKIKESLLGECNKRFGMAKQVHLLSVCTLLDPRFKKMYFTSKLDCAKAVQNIQEELQLKMDVSQQSFSTVNEQKEKEPAIPEVFDLWEDHSRLISENTKEISTSAPSSELSLYLKSSIKWWEQNKATYPNLAIIAHKYLAVVATSVPSERLFSKAGQTVTQQRNRIKGKLLSKLLFLQDIDKHY